MFRRDPVSSPTLTETRRLLAAHILASLERRSAVPTSEQVLRLISYRYTIKKRKVSEGTGFSGGRDRNGQMHPAVAPGNYGIHLDDRDAKGPDSINPHSQLVNPPPHYGIQKMHDFGGYPVVGAYGPIRARLNEFAGGESGDYFHGQFNGLGYTHGCLCYGTDTRMIDYMWNNMGQTRVGVSVQTPVAEP